MKKKVAIILVALLLVVLLPIVFLFQKFTQLEVYRWDTNQDIISKGEVQYRQCDNENINPDHLKLVRTIGKIAGEPSFRVWEIKGKSSDDFIVLTGFMFPRVLYQNVKLDDKVD